MNTLPTIEVRQAIDVKARKEVTLLTGGRPDSGTYALVEQPDGLVLVREDCGNRYCVNGKIVAATDAYDNPLGYAPCPTCLGAPLLAWYRVCDQCDGTGRRFVTIQTTIEPARREDFGPCRNCVGVDGRSLVKVRRNP